VAGPRQVVYV